MKTVRTPKGTELPLVSLKGKDYLMVAHRLIWLNEAVPSFRVETNVLRLDLESATVQAKVTLFTEEGREYKSVMATKSETKKDFPDFLEKAETGAIGRAVALAGFGTQFAIADLDEGNRLADSPVVNTKTAAKPIEVKKPTVAEAGLSPPPTAITSSGPAPEVQLDAPKKLPTFRKPKPEAPAQAASGESWE